MEPTGEFCELFQQDLRCFDPETARLMELEEERQGRKIILIASESLAPRAVREAMDSPFGNLYAEGLPSTRMSRLESDRLDDVERHLAFFRRYGDRRYYKGCEYANFVEALAQRRAAELFSTLEHPEAAVRVPPEGIYVNVQPLSGAAANNAVYTAFTSPGDTVLGMSLVSGGHLTHGSHVNRSGKEHRVVSYTVDPATGRLDYDAIAALAREHRPRLVIAGYSAYPWKIDWTAFRRISDEVGAVLLADIAHPAGLVAAGLFPSPIGVADVTMCTTHKTLCGPRGAILMTTDPARARAVDLAVFPGEQGGPHIHSMAAKAVAFRLARSAGFRALQRGIVENARHLAQSLEKRGLRLAYGGTETHLLLVDLKSVGSNRKGGGYPDGEVVSRILDLCGITCNKNTIAGDSSALRPSGIRLGTTWITQRGFGPKGIDLLAGLIQRVLTSIRPFQIRGARARLGRARIDSAVIEETRRDVTALLRSVGANLGGPRSREADAVPRGGAGGARGARGAGGATTPLAAEHAARGARSSAAPGETVPRDYGDPAAERRAATSGCVGVDLFDAGPVGVEGERAGAFLQGACTADVLRLEPGRGTRTLLLDPDGRVRFDVELVRRSDAGGRSRYLLAPGLGDTRGLVRWLRGLSDGYVLVEGGDLPAKVDGPVAVEDLRRAFDPGRRLARLGLAGPAAPGILEGLAGSAGKLAAGDSGEIRIAGVEVLAYRRGSGADRAVPLIDLFVGMGGGTTASVWRSLLEARGGSVRPAGTGVWRSLAGVGEVPRGGVPGQDGTPVPAGAVVLEKPFFVGQSHLDASGLAARPAYVAEGEEPPLRRTPLFEEHLARTRRSLMVPFAGWEMPVWYTRVSEEHRAVRQSAGLFDVAHMGVLEVRGERAVRFLDLVTTNHVPRLRVGRSHYSYVLDPDGNVLDDIIVYRLGEEEFQVVVNAANAEKILAWLRGVHSREVCIDSVHPWKEIDARVEIRDLKDPSSGGDRRVDLALQGPRSLELLRRLAGDASQGDLLGGLVGFSHAPVRLGGIEVLVSRTGYTGEPFGYELFVHPDRAVDLWRLLLAEGEGLGVVPAGLAARDSTRTEAGFPLYGHELAGPLNLNPREAGYGSFVKLHKPFFIGRDAIAPRLERTHREVVRFRTRKTRRFEPGDPVLDEGGRAVGAVTSCTLVGNSLLGLACVESEGLSKGGREIRLSWKRRPQESERGEILPRFPRRDAPSGFLDPPGAS